MALGACAGSHCRTTIHEDGFNSLVAAAQVLMGMDHLPSEADLIKLLLHVEAEQRPSLDTVLRHPCLWNDMQRLDLLVGLSNYLEEMGKVRCSLHWSVCLSVCVRARTHMCLSVFLSILSQLHCWLSREHLS